MVRLDLPKYREACPAFDVQQAWAQHGNDRDICAYRDDRGRVMGVLRFIPVSLSSAVLIGEIGGGNLRMWTGPERLKLVAADGHPSDLITATECPGCDGRVGKLLYFQYWGCRVCLNFMYSRLKDISLKDSNPPTFAGRNPGNRAFLERVEGTWMSLAELRGDEGLRDYWTTFEEKRPST